MTFSDSLFDNDFSRRKYVAHIAGKILSSHIHSPKQSHLLNHKTTKGGNKKNYNNNKRKCKRSLKIEKNHS